MKISHVVHREEVNGVGGVWAMWNGDVEEGWWFDVQIEPLKEKI